MIVVFNYSGWALRYPELSAWVSPTLAQMYFNEAQAYCDNTATSRIPDESVGGMRGTYLNMLTAHIAQLNAVINGQASPQLVGRISSASEGSVSVGVEMSYAPGSAQWFMQTKYGAAFWQATTRFRRFLYIPKSPRNMDIWQ